METNLKDSGKRKIFEPNTVEQLLRGWLLHAHKGRNRHDLSARWHDQQRIWLGGTAVVVSAIIATSASISAALQPDALPSIKIIIAMFGSLSAILIGLSTFLNLAERAEKHRSAGVRYKEIIRELERVLSIHSVKDLTNTDPTLVKIQKKLDELEEAAPVVSERIYDRVESDWKKHGVTFITTADKMYHE